MYELDRAFPVNLGPIFDSNGNFAGNAYASTMQTGAVLIKSPFTENHLVSDITPLVDRGYQFLTFPYNPPGVPGMGAASEEQYKGVFPWNS